MDTTVVDSERSQDLQAFVERRPIPDPTVLTLQMMQRELSGLKEVVYTRLEGMDKAVILLHEHMMRVPSETDKQVNHLKSLHDERFSAVQLQFTERDTRVEQMAIELKRIFDTTQQAFLERLRYLEAQVHERPAAIATQIAQLQALQEEKFMAVQVRFEERATHTAQLVVERNAMWSQALHSAKEAVEHQHLASTEAVSKAEKGMVKQVDQLTELFRGAISAMESKLSDLKERLVLIEGRTVGLSTAQTVQHAAKSIEQGSSNNLIAIIAASIGFVSLAIAVAVALIK